jgi:flavin reductase (DIM6/NTAB) family NADH-FMN oxidoreductase RutF
VPVDYDISDLSPPEREQLMNSLVVPRPIAWVSTLDAAGVGNLAPFSYFNLVSSSPPVVMIAFSAKGRKDTLANIEARREFVVNVVHHDLRHPMVVTAANVAAEVDEATLLGLEMRPSVAIATPRLAEAVATLECRLHQVIPVFDSRMALGTVEHVQVSDEVLRDGRVAAELLAPVARLGGSLYTTVTDAYRIDRPRSEEPDELRRLASGAPQRKDH